MRKFTSTIFHIYIIVNVFHAFGKPPRPKDIVPIKLSTLPYLERLTIHGQLEYVIDNFWSLIPAIMHLLSASEASSFQSTSILPTTRHRNLCSTPGFRSRKSYVPPSSIFYPKLPNLRVLYLNPLHPSTFASASMGKKPVLHIYHVTRNLSHLMSYYLSVCGELMQFVHQGVLVVTPPILFRMPHLPLMARGQWTHLNLSLPC